MLVVIKRETNNNAVMNWWTEIDRITLEKYKRQFDKISIKQRVCSVSIRAFHRGGPEHMGIRARAAAWGTTCTALGVLGYYVL